jgi:hypothetical protein
MQDTPPSDKVGGVGVVFDIPDCFPGVGFALCGAWTVVRLAGFGRRE